MTHGEPVSPGWASAFNQLEERSGGRLDTTLFWSGSLLPIPEIPRGMASGAATFSNLPTPNYPDVWPLNCRILQLPFMGLQNPVESAAIYMQLLEEFPEMKAELADFNIIPVGATPLGMYAMHFRDGSEVRRPEDLRGKQMVPFNVVFLPLLEANGVGVNYIPPGEMFEALNNNIIDGYINSWAFQGWFGLTELMNSHVNFGEYGAYQEFNILAVNLEFYNSLPADLQQLWHDVMWNDGGYLEMWDDTATLYYGEMEKGTAKGDVIVDLTPEEIDVWRQALLPQHRVVLDEINAQRGDNVADAIYQRIQEILAENYGA
ncbi:MAG: hypothetical protein FWH32_00770 [Clostridiales bacterium]|nr:hypothetical protein [Clostridiales bacterium]